MGWNNYNDFWSSTEYGDSTAWLVFFSDGTVTYADKDYGARSVSCFLEI